MKNILIRQKSERGSTILVNLIITLAGVLTFMLFIFLGMSTLIMTKENHDERIEKFNISIVEEIKNNPTFISFNDAPEISIGEAFITSGMSELNKKKSDWVIQKNSSQIEYSSSYEDKKIILSGNWKKFTIKYLKNNNENIKTYSYTLNDEGKYVKKEHKK